MPKIPSVATGAAGEHFVAYMLSCLGYVAALPRGGAMGADVLVANSDGSKTLAIQVKSTEWAMRTRGRGDAKRPSQLQFPLGHKAARINNPNLIFAFVDLRGLEPGSLEPDVYLVPSHFVHEHCRHWVDDAAMVRFHVDIAQMEPFRNNWNLVSKLLGGVSEL